MKIVVTGGAGFVGSHVAEQLSRNNQVVVCDNLSRSQTLRNPSINSSYTRDYLEQENPRIEFHNVDVRNLEQLSDASKSAHVIIHTAGQVAVRTSILNPREDFEVNALGTFNVLETARLNDSITVFCSTNKVYGENVNMIPVKEGPKRYSFEDPRYEKGIPESFPIDHTGHSPYGASKLAADLYVQDYARTYGLKTAVFRMSCIYGERQFGVEDQGWLAWFVMATLTERPITIYGDGKQVRDVLHVDDLVNAFTRFIDGKSRHDVFNIGGGYKNTLSLLELLDLLKSLTGKSPSVSMGEWRPSDQKVYISDTTHVQDKLAWKPMVTLVEGVKRVVGWVGANRNLFV